MKLIGFKYTDTFFNHSKGVLNQLPVELTIHFSEPNGAEELNIIDAIRQTLQLVDPLATKRITHFEYVQLLRAHDWHFERSDDYRTYQRGQQERDYLLDLAKQFNWQGVFDTFCLQNLGTPYFNPVPIQKLNATNEPTSGQIVEAMKRYGGSFVQSLAATYQRADAENQGIILQAFPQVFEKYRAFVVLEKQKEQNHQPELEGGEG